ncbi:hypothetical protein CLV81_2111 [Flagellimonas meridianipacifica]|uniref:Uncharacterized protein n=1 Tax=Flagellimonas meridianipacifica TaxID=1080225 RepID=A0A2T0M892_9FLAO|nr:hypothetical protein CLV81_2111 [Allomuricauda pacifica]
MVVDLQKEEEFNYLFTNGLMALKVQEDYRRISLNS